MKGEKRIAYSSITAIQVKEATAAISGYIQFSILGGLESQRGIWDASKDENSVLFTVQQMPVFQRLRECVEAKTAAPARNSTSSSNTSLAEELAKLAALRDQGVLTDQEFASSKAAAIAGKEA
ncbi:MAG: SHOCT domain-containing protein [Sphingomonadales bacterium]